VSDQTPDVVLMQGVTRRYGDLAALNNVTLAVPRGTILGVIGPSGSGKTTLIRLLTGTLEVTDGKLSVLGEHPRKFKRQTRERLGYMPQHFVLYEDLTASENLSFVASLFGMLWPNRGRRVKAMLQLVELWDARSRRARHLSGGMQRRLELACAMVHDPVLLFVDEPTAGLDPMLRQRIWSEFRRLRELGRTLVVTTQIVGEAAYCDRVAVLSQGKLVALAAPDELRKMALGGDVLVIRTAEPFDTMQLDSVPGVRDIRPRTPREFLVVADEASTALPRLVEAIGSAGGSVVSTNEHRPSFDEIFSTLVLRADGHAPAQAEEHTDDRLAARAA
jgi:ABC-2 type transport system ATP-binding protein